MRRTRHCLASRVTADAKHEVRVEGSGNTYIDALVNARMLIKDELREMEEK